MTVYRAVCDRCDWASPWSDHGQHHVLGYISPEQYAVTHAKDTGHTWHVEERP